MDAINLKKLKEMMEKGAVTRVTVHTKEFFNELEKDKKASTECLKEISIEDIDSIRIYEKYNTVAIQQSYDYSELKPHYITVTISSHDLDNPKYYAVTVKPEFLKDVLEMTNWEMLDSAKDTAKLFNELLMSANEFYRNEKLGQIVLKSTSLVRTYRGYYHDGYVPPIYSVSGTEIDNKVRFETMEEVYDAVNQNYIDNVILKNDNSLEVK